MKRRDKSGRFIAKGQRLHAPKRDKSGKFVKGSRAPSKKTTKTGRTLDPEALARELQDTLANEVDGAHVDVEPVKAKHNHEWHDYLISWREPIDPSDEDSDGNQQIETIASVARDVLLPHYGGKLYFRTANEYNPPAKGEEDRQLQSEWITLGRGEPARQAFNNFMDKITDWLSPQSGIAYYVTEIRALSILVEAPHWYRHKGADHEAMGTGKKRARGAKKNAAHAKRGKGSIKRGNGKRTQKRKRGSR